MKRASLKKSKGYLLLSAIVLVVAVGFLVGTVARLAITESHSTTLQLDAAEAGYIAETGVAYAMSLVHRRQFSCAALVDHPIKEKFKGGEFELSAKRYYFKYDGNYNKFKQLVYDISATSKVIPVRDLSYYASYGRVMIDKELIDYKGTSNDTAVCGNRMAPCLIGLTRGAGGSTATAHTTYSIISQNQCNLTIESGMPNLTNPKVKRTIGVTIKQNFEGWVAGSATEIEGAKYKKSMFIRGDGGQWARDMMAPDTYRRIYGLSMISYADGWAVGQGATSTPGLFRWYGNKWYRLTYKDLPKDHLYGIDCLSGNDCWAVGSSSTIIHYNGAGWTESAKANNIPNAYLKGVSCVPEREGRDFCWAFGYKKTEVSDKSYEPILLELTWKLNKNQWVGEWKQYKATWLTGKVISYSSVPYGGISCTNKNFCMVAGPSRFFAKWDGAIWEEPEVNKNLNSSTNIKGISCVDPNYCWAVGYYRFALWNGQSWVRKTGGEMTKNYYAVKCDAKNDCWAAGSHKKILHWNGSAWTLYSPSGTMPSSQYFYAIDFISPGAHNVGFWIES